ncbi:leptin receptor [Eublepharis macularius]|uniref:Leptin receptor n=1 Tax=Eublepharis macularius TaxID=481883 RepID=A0AA97KZE4_EUBMA|nr:leptin receptor [Eublepharis macularius]
MSRHNILNRFLQLIFLQVVISHCMVYQIPPQNFQLPCEPTGKNSGFPSSVGTVENGLSSNEEHGPITANATSLAAEDHFLCCDWTDTYVNCFVYTAEMETKAFPQLIEDSVWNLQFWTTVSSEELFCIVGLSSKISSLTEDFTVNLFYTLTDVSLEGNSTNSLKNNFTVTHCIAIKHPKYACQIPSMKLNHTYVMWLKISQGMALLRSPLMSVVPLDIVKPEPPLHMTIEITDKGQLKISWSNPTSKLYPLQYEVKYSANATKNVYQAVEITMETSLILSNTLLDSSYIVQVRCKSLYGPGLWSDWSSPFNMNLQDVMYFPPKILASVGTNVSFYCIYKNKNKIISSKKIVWWLNLAKEVPRSQYTLVNDFVGKVTLVNLDAMKPGGNFLFNALYCCNENKECNHRYAELYIIDVNINITCETYGNLQKMTCRWSTNTDLLLSESTLLLRYYRSDVYCSESSSMSSDSEVKECHSQRNNSYECIFQPFYLLSGYTMWIEIKHPLGTLTSQPVCILPKEVVKPFPPFNVKAEITREVGMLNVSWNNPELPKSDLQFQIRYAINGTEIIWEMHEVSTVSGSCACIEVQDPCAVYIVQVRCSVLEGIGYWSDWSRPAFTVVKDIKAPLRGPEFWRIINEDPVRKQKNVTLFWKPLVKNLALCSVLEYVIEHTTSEYITWSDYVENDTTYSFPWTEDIHTLKVIAVNSIGASSVNFIITLSQQMNAVNIMKSLSVYPVNSSCVIVSWMLSPAIYVVTSFVIEWTNLNEEEQMKWIMVPSHIRKCHIYDDFILIEKYRFSVYPIIPEGVGKPTVTEGFSKGGIEKQSYMNFYVILPLVILCLVFLLGALLILHQRMKTLFWDDVPNPKNCSWAQSVNFQKPETFEHLFLKHPEALSFGPLLLEPEIVLEDISVHKAMKNEDKQDLLAVDSLFATIQDLERDSACSSGHFNSDSLLDAEISEGAAGQSNVKYATIISNSLSSGLYEPPRDLNSSFETCLLGHDTSIPTSLSNSSWAMGNPAFLIFPDGRPDSPKKMPSVSAVSSEGFSEPSDQDRSFTEEHTLRRSMFYLGMNSIKRSENDIFLTENSNMICHFHTSALFHGMRFPRNMCSDLNPFISKCETSVQTFIPYMPQFQTLTIKLHETANSKT